MCQAGSYSKGSKANFLGARTTNKSFLDQKLEKIKYRRKTSTLKPSSLKFSYWGQVKLKSVKKFFWDFHHPHFKQENLDVRPVCLEMGPTILWCAACSMGTQAPTVPSWFQSAFSTTSTLQISLTPKSKGFLTSTTQKSPYRYLGSQSLGLKLKISDIQNSMLS